jgi:Carboxypeptidase regulatory-like domain/TonB dependent receptor
VRRKRSSLYRNLALLFMFSLLLLVSAFAQQSTGDITGRVLDQQGGAVPNATVTARNKATGTTRTTNTNEQGEYTLAELPPGAYEVTVEAKGFSKALLKDYELNLGATPTVNFDLKPGEVNETVEVTTEGALVETTTSEIGRNITPTEVRELPLINRTFASLSVIAPEARPVGTFDPTKTRVGTIGFSGGDGRQLDVNVDGGDDKDNVVGSLLQNFAYESIQEFQVLQHRWTAESGRSVGAVVNVITKSGTNQLHGSGFFTYRNQSLRARDFFEKTNNLTKPDFNREEFGGSVGGPIKKDKLFFFGALEHFRERQSIALTNDQVAQINAIPGVTASPLIPTPYNDTLLTAKIDHHLSERQSMSYRFSYQKNDSPNDQVDPTQPSDLAGGNTNNNKLYSFVVNHTYTFGPTSLNQFTFQFQRFQNDILGVTTNPNLLFPSVQSGANVNVPQETIERKFQFRDDYSFQRGNHALKVGVNYINTKLDGFFFFGANGYQITFFDDPLTIRNNLNGKYPQGFATPGAVNEITFNTGSGDTSQPAFHQLAFYVQDDYKATRKLTLNLGLRWDANIDLLVPQTNNRTMLILKRLNDPRAQAIAGDANRLARTTPSWKEFQPRVGFAYDPKGDGRTVIRGGFGLFYDQLFQNLTLFSTQQSNPTIYQTVLDLVNSNVGVGQLAGFRFGTDPLPTPPASANNTDLAPGSVGRINDPTLRDPYVEKFSIGFEHNMGRNFVLSSDYVHTLGLHENRVLNMNPQIRSICDPTFPGSTPNSPRCVNGASTRFFDQAFVAAGLGVGRLGQINMFSSTNRSLFDSWATTLRYRGRKSLYTVSYVLSNSRAWGGQPTASYSGNGIVVTPEQQFRPEEFGPTRIDERHRVVLSGVFNLPYGLELAPIMQLASARPYSALAGIDVDGDGRSSIDRICAGVDPVAVLQSIVNGRGVPAAAQAPGCTQAKVNSIRGGFVVVNGQLQQRSGRYFDVDMRVTRIFSLGEKVKIKPYANFFNLFNVENLSFADRLGTSTVTSSSTFLQPASLYGPGFGPPVGVPFTFQFGARVDF